MAKIFVEITLIGQQKTSIDSIGRSHFVLARKSEKVPAARPKGDILFSNRDKRGRPPSEVIFHPLNLKNQPFAADHSPPELYAL
jgi:hypothetical protein